MSVIFQLAKNLWNKSDLNSLYCLWYKNGYKNILRESNLNLPALLAVEGQNVDPKNAKEKEIDDHFKINK